MTSIQIGNQGAKMEDPKNRWATLANLTMPDLQLAQAPGEESRRSMTTHNAYYSHAAFGPDTKMTSAAQDSWRKSGQPDKTQWAAYCGLVPAISDELWELISYRVGLVFDVSWGFAYETIFAPGEEARRQVPLSGGYGTCSCLRPREGVCAVCKEAAGSDPR